MQVFIKNSLGGGKILKFFQYESIGKKIRKC